MRTHACFSDLRLFGNAQHLFVLPDHKLGTLVHSLSLRRSMHAGSKAPLQRLLFRALRQALRTRCVACVVVNAVCCPPAIRPCTIEAKSSMSLPV